MKKVLWLGAVVLMVTTCGTIGQETPHMTLGQKAALFEHDMRQRFLLDGQALCKLKLRAPDRPYISYNMPDNAYMTGIYLGTLALKYAATQDPEVRKQASESIRALHLLCTISGRPGLLARSAWPKDMPFSDDGDWQDAADGRHKWRADVSSDQVDGVMFGYALAYDWVASDEEKTLIGRDVAAIADHILNNNLRIVDYNGRPTTWGKYYPSYVTTEEPMNALLLLQVLKVAHHVTGEARFAEIYRKTAIERNYATIALKARAMGNPLVPDQVNHSDDVLLFLAYYPLLKYEEEPELRELYLASLRNTSNGSGSPLIRDRSAHSPKKTN